MSANDHIASFAADPDDSVGPRPCCVRFEPGNGVAIVAERVVCLVLDDPESDLVQALRSRLVGAVGADVALDAMVRAGGLDLPPFGLVALEGDRARVVVRARIRVLVRPIEFDDSDTEFGGELVSTWVEHVVDSARSITLTADISFVDELPIYEVGAGVVPAGTVAVVLGRGPVEGFVPAMTTAPDAEPSEEWPSGEVERTPDLPESVVATDASESPVTDSDAAEGDVVDSEPLVHDSNDPTEFRDPERDQEVDVVPKPSLSVEPLLHPLPPLPGSVDDDAHVVVPEPVDHGATLVGPFDFGDSPDDELVASPPDPAASPVEPVGSPGPFDQAQLDPEGFGPVSAAPADDYDHLFGATQFRTVEQAAIRADEDEPGAEGGHVAEVPSGDAATDLPGGDLIGGLDADHDGHTVSMASLRAQLQRSVPPPGSSPTVHAVHCPSGHLNPTHAGTCRVCGGSIEDQEHMSVPRPVLGTFRFTDGRVVSVTRPLVIGRSPAAEGQISGEPPELIVVASPLKEVSSTHLEVRLEGWQVLLVDRQSTNGTVITAPDRDPQRLRPGDAVPISPGTKVSLADELEFVFEASQ